MDTVKPRRMSVWALLAGMLILINLPVALFGQKITTRGPVQESQLITLSSTTPFDQALRVIQAFSNKVVVDPLHHTIPIGIDIDRQPWLLALVEVARHHGLHLTERNGYYELGAEAEKVSPVEPETPEITADSREVIISAIFFQADRSVIRELGIDWSTLSSGRVDLQASQQSSGLVSSNLLTVGVHTDVTRSISIDALLKTFETQNTGEIVAKPQIRVQDRKTGYIQVGSDFSITTADFSGNAISQFYSTGTILTVTPRIYSEEDMVFVDLEVEAERSALVDPVRNLISKTVARTSALLQDGEYTAIGGLYGQEISETRTGIPLLMDLPRWFFGLRYLFGHTGKRVTKTELVVLLKVDLVPSVRERIRQSIQEDAGTLRRRKRSEFEQTLRDLRKETAVPDSLDY